MLGILTVGGLRPPLLTSLWFLFTLLSSLLVRLFVLRLPRYLLPAGILHAGPFSNDHPHSGCICSSPPSPYHAPAPHSIPACIWGGECAQDRDGGEHRWHSRAQRRASWKGGAFFSCAYRPKHPDLHGCTAHTLYALAVCIRSPSTLLFAA